MATLTIRTQPQLVGTTDTDILKTPSIEDVPADSVALYLFLPDADDYRHAEKIRAWDFLYRGWKKNAYKVFPGVSLPVYIAVPIDKPTISNRILTTDKALIVSGMVAIGIGANFVQDQKNILQCNTAFGKLAGFYKEIK